MSILRIMIYLEDKMQEIIIFFYGVPPMQNIQHKSTSCAAWGNFMAFRLMPLLIQEGEVIVSQTEKIMEVTDVLVINIPSGNHEMNEDDDNDMEEEQDLPTDQEGETSPSVMGSIKLAMAAEYARDEAEELYRKHNNPLSFDQWDAILTSLARLSALLRLVASSAHSGRNGTAFNQDIHATMVLALEELEQVSTPLHRMAPPKAGRRNTFFTRKRLP